MPSIAQPVESGGVFSPAPAGRRQSLQYNPIMPPQMLDSHATLTNGSHNGSARTRAEATRIPTAKKYAGPAMSHTLNLGDARTLDWIEDESVHLVVTSPPYFNLKKYNEHPGQLARYSQRSA